MERFRLFAFVIALWLIALIVQPVVFAGERVYTFDDDKAWEVLSGKWEVENGEFLSTRARDGVLRFPADIALLKETEGIDTQDIDFISVKAFGLGKGVWQDFFIVFSHDGKSEFYHIAGAIVDAQEWRFDRVFTKTNIWDMHFEWIRDDRLRLKTWYNIRVEFKRNTMTLFGGEVGKELKKQVSHIFEADEGGIQRGRVGLGSWNSVLKYDDFRIGGTFLAVAPLGKLTTVWGQMRSF